MHILKYLATTLWLTGSFAATTPFCKRDPSSSQWPSAQQWQALNNSVSGALQVPTAPGAVCHPDQPNFDNSTCTAFLASFSNTSWIGNNPWMADYNDDTCLPSAAAPCSTAGYPAYVVEANNASDVAAGIKFANENQVRLIVKGTGHDFPGRSSGPGSLSIWTHKLQGVDINMGDPKAVQYGGVASVKIAAGMRWGEIYAVAAENNLTMIGGADPHVGIGGWTTGGGHGPLTAKYGLGADQVLEMDVVTADGQILTINETSNCDLFWAMRGGGGSTFAVLTSMTVKAYSSIPASIYFFSYNTTVDSDTFWSATAYFHADLPRISESGGMGYYYIVPSAGTQSTIAGIWIFPQQTVAQVEAIVSPWEQTLNNTPSWATDKIYVGSYIVPVPDFMKAWLANPPAAGGVDGRLASYLFDGSALTANVTNFKSSMSAISQPPMSLLGHLVAGPGTHNVTVPGGSNAVLPAWRKAYAHIVATVTWTPLNLTEKNAETWSLRNQILPTLRSLAPDSGAYMNENDPTNPQWKQDYYGVNYDRLYQIKQKYDPTGVFWCKPCVGNDDWTVVNGSSLEDPENWGVGQVGGQICKT